jgi:signal transduction histidine kinase
MSEINKMKKGPLTKDFDLSLVANFAHQLINPLNGVAGTLDRLHKGKIQGEHRQKQRINAMRAQIENCIVLTRNLSYLAIGFGELKDTDKRTVILPQNLIEATLFYEEEALDRKIEIHVEERDIQNSVRAHPDLIRQVFMNLIDNSVKYSEPGSKILISHHIQKGTGDALIAVRSIPADMIAPQDLAHIFEVGYRGENAKRIIASGTGLGLFICSEIIRTAHGGDISVNRYATNGIEFIVRLPNGTIGKSDKRYVKN